MGPSLFDVPAAAIVHWMHNFGLKSRKREITKIGRVSSAKQVYSGDKVLCFPRDTSSYADKYSTHLSHRY